MLTNTKQVAIKVAIVIPEIGLDEDPIIPTIRELTVTKKKPKITTSSPIKRVDGNCPGSCGNRDTIKTSTSDPMATYVIGISRSVLGGLIPAFKSFKLLKLSRNAETIVGRVLINVIKPAAATAPAPIYR